MGPNALFSRPLLLGFVVVTCGCGGAPVVSPVSPSSLTHSLAASDSSIRVRSSDYHGPEPAPTPMPDPGPGPTPDLPPAPDPVPGPTPDPAPVPPTALTITIVGSFGSGAYLPNPIQAALGDMIVWTNNDRTLHQIVLDDGTMVGDIAPGQSSAPISLTTATATYRCTIHPSMVGRITTGPAAELGPPSAEPLPTEPGAPPPATPPMEDPYYNYRR